MQFISEQCYSRRRLLRASVPWMIIHGFAHLGVDYDLHVHCTVFLEPLDSSQRDPEVVGVEDLEL